MELFPEEATAKRRTRVQRILVSGGMKHPFTDEVMARKIFNALNISTAKLERAQPEQTTAVMVQTARNHNGHDLVPEGSVIITVEGQRRIQRAKTMLEQHEANLIKQIKANKVSRLLNVLIDPIAALNELREGDK
jgi:hypothetical protein